MSQEAADGPGRAGETGRSAAALDEVDRRILDELTQDGRISIRTLAERVHVSRTNAYARVERLLRDGVISGFAARIAPEAAGLGTSAYIALTIRQDTWREVSAELARVRYVEHVALLSGEHDVLALVRAPDNATLRDVVLDRVQRIAGVLSTRSWLVFDEYDGVVSPWA
ncbi:DNA-binding transcriptional regulator, Lrp family [Micromonospora phaseoli]|uniref:DNA-binding transcriptional regulator, Lrp family n=1 Tax=Micromonospora phaseoli TaxID=1144548 RepID=A0A1H6YSA8_9ACTN|nr:Lrp/AsnC family transcriptional regulator [Micromonospora phaseoli]PZW00382.1 DNA-binding Lrp family transcriptional regulator [Micromonospora phaseoli]GIJ76861.1 putative transcriptional regulator, AsnC family protein [Micromonospora phaseoli]SEJ44208.1 DNA-binding transcriptional regulator, Lrp family [Micromonospora phaseoli]